MTRHFSIDEFTKSATAEKNEIDNSLPLNLLSNAQFCLAGLERIRAFLAKPILINSGYRCEKLNTIIGGAKNSDHLKALAVDFRCPDFGDPEKIYNALVPMIKIIGIDQLILERTWIHVSFKYDPRYEAFRLS